MLYAKLNNMVNCWICFVFGFSEILQETDFSVTLGKYDQTRKCTKSHIIKVVYFDSFLYFIISLFHYFFTSQSSLMSCLKR